MKFSLIKTYAPIMFIVLGILVMPICLTLMLGSGFLESSSFLSVLLVDPHLYVFAALTLYFGFSHNRLRPKMVALYITPFKLFSDICLVLIAKLSIPEFMLLDMNYIVIDIIVSAVYIACYAYCLASVLASGCDFRWMVISGSIFLLFPWISVLFVHIYNSTYITRLDEWQLAASRLNVFISLNTIITYFVFRALAFARVNK